MLYIRLRHCVGCVILRLGISLFEKVFQQNRKKCAPQFSSIFRSTATNIYLHIYFFVFAPWVVAILHKKIDSVLADWSFVGVRGRRLVVEFTKNLYSVIPSRQNRNKNNFFLLNNGKIAGNIWTKYYLIQKSYLPSLIWNKKIFVAS